MLIYVLSQHLLITLGDRCAIFVCTCCKRSLKPEFDKYCWPSKETKIYGHMCLCISRLINGFIELQSVCCISFPFIELLF